MTELFQLRAAGITAVIDLSDGYPSVLHWGADIGDLKANPGLLSASVEPVPHGDLDHPMKPGLWRENSLGFLGRPALLGHRAGFDWSQKFVVTKAQQNGNSLAITAVDVAAKLELAVVFELTEEGILLVTQTVTNNATDNFEVTELNHWLPLPERANESLDYSGAWIKERQPQRRKIQTGTWAREVREGRTSHDYTIVQLAMTEAANYQIGEVWSVGLMWSGNSRHLIERLPSDRTMIGAGELLLPGEIILAAGESYTAPTVAATYSGEGIDGITDRYYRWLRARKNHPSKVRPRPLTLNVWEAVYFDHNLEKLTQLADVAKEVGVERFVLDDGWFGARRDDKAGLGDWVVAPEVWPNGLKPLADMLEARGIEFGLWFEGEMIQVDSDLYRAHPDWVLRVGDRMPMPGRQQQVLDLTHSGAYSHVLEQVSAVLASCKISYIKWDHNRSLTEPGHLGRAAVREQTFAIYRLFDELKERFPGLEIESCSSGGGRIDLGMVQHADRFWTSDCNDALERQYIQRYTQTAIPPELLGSHIGPRTAHTTHRTHSLSFRAVTALFGHAGIEWDITECTDEERAALKSWVSYYKANRELLHSGKMIRVEQPNQETFVHGVVAQDRSKAIFAYASLRASAGSLPGALRIVGLDSDRTYQVRMVAPAGEPIFVGRKQPSWFDGVELTGAALANVGLKTPVIAPEQAFLVEFTAI
ncbi:MAG: alpha-galactosidase [Micrococcales bacterium]